ncbi:MAG: hypothetical protein EBS56_11760, partial [Planctomycetia bacterium]|nr:hypothetical protein [Planctomycetia bacterium]
MPHIRGPPDSWPRSRRRICRRGRRSSGSVRRRAARAAHDASACAEDTGTPRRHCSSVRRRWRGRPTTRGPEAGPRGILAGMPDAPASLVTETAATPAERRQRSLMMRACRREPVERTPVWLMRQAGRYLPEYRAVREKVGFLELCKNPGLSAEVMIATVSRLGVDAAIIFSDLLPILEPMGMDLEFAAGEGPVIHNPLREPADVARLRELERLDALEYVMEVVRATRAGLDDALPVIGFAGAPFTLAGYCIEGGTSRAWLHTKSLMYRHESAWHDLMGRIARAVSRYLVAQID